MKKNFTLILLFCSFCLVAQNLEIGVSYKYLFPVQWDKMIQTYNYSRPYLQEKQPLLKNGVAADGIWHFGSEKKLSHGIAVSYSFLQSSSENLNLTNQFNLHFLNLGYDLTYCNPEKMNSLRFDAIVGATGSYLGRKVNGENYVFDDSTSSSLGIGVHLAFKMAYRLSLSSKIGFSPFLLVGYSPYFYSPYTESVINQTKGLVASNWTFMYSAQAGLSFFLGKK